MESLKLNVSIVTYQTPVKELANCLESLLKSAAVNRIDIVDNAREPEIKSVCESCNDPRVCYYPNPNVGFGRAHNQSLRRTLSEGIPYHLVLNADVYFDDGTLEKCLAYMDKNERAGQLIPRVVFPDGHFQSVCHPLPTPIEMILHRFTPWGWNRKRIMRYELRDRDLTEPRNVPVHHGCFMLFRTSAIREVGLFDERFFMYAEDFDLTRRMHERYQTVYFPHATVVHIFGGGSRVNPRLFWTHCKSMVKYFCKWGWAIDRKRWRYNKRLWESLPKIGIPEE